MRQTNDRRLAERIEQLRVELEADERLFWAWLEPRVSATTYVGYRAQPIEFVRQLHAAAWSTAMQGYMQQALIKALGLKA